MIYKAINSLSLSSSKMGMRKSKLYNLETIDRVAHPAGVAGVVERSNALRRTVVSLLVAAFRLANYDENNPAY